MAERRRPTGVQASLRLHIDRCGESRYRLAAETGVPQSVLSRFMDGGDMRGDNLDRLCRYLKLELRPVRRGKERD